MGKVGFGHKVACMHKPSRAGLRRSHATSSALSDHEASDVVCILECADRAFDLNATGFRPAVRRSGPNSKSVSSQHV
jgi:hypothetical protein